MLNLLKGFDLVILHIILSASFFFNKAKFPGSPIKGKKKILSTNKLAVAFSHFTLSGHPVTVIASLVFFFFFFNKPTLLIFI